MLSIAAMATPSAFSAWEGRAKDSKATAERATVPQFGLDWIKVIDDQVGFF
jgi:hypothetical protein